MLHPQYPNEKKITFISPYGQWHITAKNFGLISDTFTQLFAPLSVIPLPRNISYQAAEIIRAYTRHPNSSILNFEDPKSCRIIKEEEKLKSILDVFNKKKDEENKSEEWKKVFDIIKVITDVYEFSSRWGIKRPLREAAQYSFDHFTPEEIIKIISDLSIEKTKPNDISSISKSSTKSSKSKNDLMESFDKNYVGYNYGGIVDTSELDSIVAHHIDQYIHILNRLPFFKINQILCKVKSLQKNDKICKKHRKADDLSNLSISINDILLDFIINDLENIDFRTKEVLISRFVDLSECTPQKLSRLCLYNDNSGQNIDLVTYSLKKLAKADEELFVVKEELSETKAKFEAADKNSSQYLNGLQSLFEGKHGLPELTYLTAIREKKVTPADEDKKIEELLEVTIEQKIPESLFESAKRLETTDSKQSLSIYQELTTNFNEKSDKLVSDHIIELTKLRERNLATSILKIFVKTNRPKMLLTAYKASLIDYKVVSTATGERCLKRAARLGDKEAFDLYSEYLLVKDPIHCLKFCLDHSEQEPSLLFNVGSILLLGCKGPTTEAVIDNNNSNDSSTKEVEIEEVKIEPLASPVTIPDSPYLPSPRGKNGNGFSPFDEKQKSEGETFNLNDMEPDLTKNTKKNVDRSIEASPWKSIKYFEKAASKGFNVANLVLSVISNSERKRKEYYETFMINSSRNLNKEDDSTGKRICPRTKFVIRVVLALFDLIVDRFPDIENELLGLVNTLIVQDKDASTAEFLFTRSSSTTVIDALTQKAPQLPEFIQKEVDEYRKKLVNSVPAIRSTVHRIKEQEFKERDNIGEVLRFPQYLESIGERAFFKCNSLKCIQFDYEIHKSRKNQTPSSQKQYYLKLIDKFAFYDCSQLQAILFNKISDETNGDSKVGIRSLSIGDSVFSNCSNLCYVELPENLVKIDERLFYSCEKLISVQIPQRTEEIGESAFEGCKSLEFIALHNGIKRIKEGCFQFCENLKIIIIPQNIKTIASRSFRLCKSVTTLVIQEGVNTIESDAFAGCKQLGFVSFPKRSLKKIYCQAFAQCPSLKKVVIPKSCIVENGAFDDGVDISFFDDEDIFEDNDSEVIKMRAQKKNKKSFTPINSKESEEFAFENANE